VLRVLVVAATALLLAGCGGGDDETTAPPGTTAVSGSGTGCTPATTDIMTPLANKLSTPNGRLINGQIAKSAQQDDVYFVSAEIDSPELQTAGDIATWATSSPHGAEAIYSVNDLAITSSRWGKAATEDIAADDPAAAASRACVSR